MISPYRLPGFREYNAKHRADIKEGQWQNE